MDGEYGVECPFCGAITATEELPAEPRCAQCGNTTVLVRPLFGGSYLYSFADRSRGPAPEDEALVHLAVWAGLVNERRGHHALWEQSQRLGEKRDEGSAWPVRIDQVLAEAHILDRGRSEQLVRLSTIAALSECDGLFCKRAVKAKLLTPAQLADCRAEQERWLKHCGQAPLIEFLVIRRGFAAPAQVGEILKQEALDSQGILAQAQRAEGLASLASKMPQLDDLKEAADRFREQHPSLAKVSLFHRNPRMNVLLVAGLAGCIIACALSAAPRPQGPMPLRFQCAECGCEFEPSQRQLEAAAQAEGNPLAWAKAGGKPPTRPPAAPKPAGIVCPSCGQPAAFRAYRCGAPDCGKWFVPKSARGPVDEGYLPTCPHCGWQPALEPSK